MKVRYSYLAQQFADVEPVFEQIRQHLKTCNFTLGPEVAQFESAFAQLIGTQRAVGVGSGTDALKLALKAIGIGHGDEVITAANTFIATVGAIHELGAKPVLVDATAYFTIDATRIERAITPRTKAILPVHFTGEPADMDAISEIAMRHDIPIVEDACQSILAEYNGRRCGTIGIAAGFSLHPLKNLNVWGDAGVIVTNASAIDEKLRLLRNHGLKNRDEIEILGFNSRLDSIQAIVGNWLIKDTEMITRKRIANGERYDSRLSKLDGRVFLPPRRKEAKRVFHLYMFEVSESDRDPLYRYLHDRGVEAKIHYPIPLYLQKGLGHLGHKRGDFPVTDSQSDRVITLPVDQHLTDGEIDYCASVVEEFFAGR